MGEDKNRRMTDTVLKLELCNVFLHQESYLHQKGGKKGFSMKTAELDKNKNQKEH